jgi:biopolymer transport protein ExbD
MVAVPPARLRSEINVTPLVDVCLVLLIIFMVVTPLLTSGPPMELAKANSPDKRPQTPSQLPIYLIFDDPPQILFGTDFHKIDPTDFAAAMKDLRAPDQRLVLRADRRLDYRSVKAVLRSMREAGFQNVDLIVEREKRGEGEAPRNYRSMPRERTGQ